MPVKAARIDHPFTVTTKEGATYTLDQGWLLEGDDGRRWGVDLDYFEQHYKVLTGERARFHPIFGCDATPEERARIDDIKAHVDHVRVLILERVPSNRERALALTHLEDAAMRATRAILEGERELRPVEAATTGSTQRAA